MRTFSKVTLVRSTVGRNADNSNNSENTMDSAQLPPNFHMRRCHLCDAVNIHPIVVKHCENCKKPVTPFYYYEEGAVEIYAESEGPHYRPIVPTEYGPLIGVTVMWNE